MDFWLAIVIIVIAVTSINAYKEIKVRRSNFKDSDATALQQDITQIRKEIEEIKGYIADLVIKLHDQK